MTQDLINCPYCGKEIMARAMKCMHCGKILVTADQQMASAKHVLAKNEKSPFVMLFKIALFLVIAGTIYNYKDELLDIIKKFL